MAALKKLGIPDVLMDVIRYFHSYMKARMRVNEELLDEIEVENGS